MLPAEVLPEQGAARHRPDREGGGAGVLPPRHTRQDTEVPVGPLREAAHVPGRAGEWVTCHVSEPRVTAECLDRGHHLHQLHRHQHRRPHAQHPPVLSGQTKKTLMLYQSHYIYIYENSSLPKIFVCHENM